MHMGDNVAVVGNLALSNTPEDAKVCVPTETVLVTQQLVKRQCANRPPHMPADLNTLCSHHRTPSMHAAGSRLAACRGTRMGMPCW